MLNAAVGGYYYLRIVVVMYLRPSKETVVVRGGWPVAVAVGACASLTVAFGLFWTPVAATALRRRTFGHGASGSRETPGRTDRRGGHFSLNRCA